MNILTYFKHDECQPQCFTLNVFFPEVSKRNQRVVKTWRKHPYTTKAQSRTLASELVAYCWHACLTLLTIR